MKTKEYIWSVDILRAAQYNIAADKTITAEDKGYYTRMLERAFEHLGEVALREYLEANRGKI